MCSKIDLKKQVKALPVSLELKAACSKLECTTLKELLNYKGHEMLDAGFTYHEIYELMNFLKANEALHLFKDG